jgi:GDPmannose 4,6-dehydratase
MYLKVYNCILLMPTALVIGANGQDSSYCIELLLSKGYIVHGIIRRSSVFTTKRIEHVFDKINLHYGDLTDAISTFNIIKNTKPDEIYNFAAQSHVKVSSEVENYTIQANTIGILNILQSVKTLGYNTKIYQAGTSEQYGNQTDGTDFLNEETKMKPVSIYGISKMAAQNICDMYRDAYGMFIVSSILFNHESSRRGDTFVTKKITNYALRYRSCRGTSTPIPPLELGNLNAMRDWGHAKDYVYAIYLMLQQDKPQNYVIATGESHSVREFVEMAFEFIGVNITWRGEGINEVGVDSNGIVIVKVNDKYYRDIDINVLLGDSSKARRELGWKPEYTFKDLVHEMMSGTV